MSSDKSRHLRSLCYQYQYIRSIIGDCNKAKDYCRRSTAFVVMNQIRAEINAEIKYLSWQVWPETGRPYNCKSGVKK